MQANIELDVLDLSFSPKEASQLSSFANKFANIKDLTLVQCEIQHLQTLQLDEMKSLENLDLAVNSIESIGENNFVSLKKLKYLNMRLNKLVELKQNALNGLENLEFLDLNSNKIENIPEKAFLGLNKLTNLDLNFNKFKSVTFEMFSDCKELRKLMIFENPIENIDEDFLFKMRNLKEFDFSKSLDKKKLETNKLAKLFNTSHCENLFIDSKLFENMFENLSEPLKSLKNVSVINLTDQNINILNEASGKLGESIEELKLSSSSVISLFSQESESDEDENQNPKFILEKLKNLKRLEISNMIISNVDISKCFESLVELTVVIDNQRRSEHLKMFEFVFKHKFKALKHLSLKSSFINEYLIDFNSTLLNRMKNLETLILHKLFRFATTSTSVFSKLKQLKKLEIYGNQIKVVSSELLDGLFNLTDLSLEGNQIERIEPSAFIYLNKLEKLNISVNQIKTLRREHFNGLENSLKYLDISDNSTEVIELNAFKNFKQLKRIKFY